jgi:hypothetical protein
MIVVGYLSMIAGALMVLWWPPAGALAPALLITGFLITITGIIEVISDARR